MSFLLPLLSRSKDFIIRWRWGIIGLIGLGIFLFEYFEESPLNLVHIGEFLLYLLFLIIIGNLIDKLLRVLDEKTHANTILNLKHKLSLKLALAKDMQELSSSVIEFLASTANPVYSSLIIYDAENETFKTVGERESDEELPIYPQLHKPSAACQACKGRNLNSLQLVSTCTNEQNASIHEGINGYCLPLAYGNSKVALLRFILPLDKTLAPEQLDIIQNMSTEIATAIKSIQQREALAELSIAEATQAERREISRDLHDILGQNLSYLRFKLDQFTLNGHLKQLSEIRGELEEMRDVADASYELVRGVLETLHPSPTPHLSQLLLNQIRSLSDTSGLEIDFKEHGQPHVLSAHASRHIFFAFTEAMRNMAQHSDARNAEVSLLWSNDDLTIKIHDDGHGFDPDTIQRDKHFGLAIMQERIQALGGHYLLQSTQDLGTDVTFIIPLEAVLESSLGEDRMSGKVAQNPVSQNENTAG